MPVGLARVDEVGPAGDVDDGLGERLVERHERVAVPGDAGLVAERLRAAPGRCTMATSSTVWWASTSTSPLARHREVDAASASTSAVSMWS